jgi:demethylmenaquinone methyltransferase/2-methoxy-6-polyprenyl-1,4-benzoquinol methylase
MFDRAAPRYDILNSLMSLGRDAAWRRELARELRPGERVLDLCCGSARSAVAVHRRTGAVVVGVDLSARMLAELWRVLRPGGWLHVLDSPTPPAGFLGAAHRAYLRGVVPLLGRLSADPAAYRYLAESVIAFGTAGEVAARLADAGFECRPPVTLFCRAAAVWRARRPAVPAAPLRNATPGAGAVPSARAAAAPDR